MSDFINDLELSSRASRVLTVLGVTNVELLLALQKASVMGIPQAGRRTWNEIQAAIVTKRWERAAGREFAQLQEASARINRILKAYPDFGVSIQDGQLVAYRADGVPSTYAEFEAAHVAD